MMLSMLKEHFACGPDFGSAGSAAQSCALKSLGPTHFPWLFRGCGRRW